MYRILLVEDDAALADAITQVLTAWGHEVQKVRDFRHVTEEFAEWKPQIVLMDLMLPFFNGHHWTQELRRITSVPIVYLSSASDNLNIVMAMNMGGDDFIAKPVDPAVLAAKVNAVLRRAYDMPATGNILACGEAVLDELPSPRTLSEADDQAIMQRLLHDVRAAQSDLAAYRQDSTDYFTAWVHQIKTPLSVMRLQLQSEDTPENRAMLAELFQMEQYVTMALSYARLGNPTKDLVLTRVPLDPLIRQAIRDFAPLLIRKKLRLQYEPTAESALTDSKWLLFILHQLLSNAVKYTERGRVSIRVTSAPAIIVADTGIGIAPEDVPRVFEKGYTGYNGRGGQKSTGLGLYLVHQTAEMLHCRVSLSSRIGEGTSVTIDLHQEELGKE